MEGFSADKLTVFSIGICRARDNCQISKVLNYRKLVWGMPPRRMGLKFQNNFGPIFQQFFSCDRFRSQIFEDFFEKSLRPATISFERLSLKVTSPFIKHFSLSCSVEKWRKNFWTKKRNKKKERLNTAAMKLWREM